MRKQKEMALLICSIVGGIADFLAIAIAFKTWSITYLVLVITIILFLVTIVYIFIKYRERCDFLGFIQYLFDNPTHNFNLLPKICLSLDKSKETNNLSVRDMSIKYTYDMRKIDLDSIEKNRLRIYINM